MRFSDLTDKKVAVLETLNRRSRRLQMAERKRVQQGVDGTGRALSREEQRKIDEVVRLWEGAAKEGHALAQFNLGIMYLSLIHI